MLQLLLRFAVFVRTHGGFFQSEIRGCRHQVEEHRNQGVEVVTVANVFGVLGLQLGRRQADQPVAENYD